MAKGPIVAGAPEPEGKATETTKTVDPPTPVDEPVDEEQRPAAATAGFVIKVRGPEDGRWRAGIKFGPIEQEIDLSTITRAQAREIAEDPYLTVRRAE